MRQRAALRWSPGTPSTTGWLVLVTCEDWDGSGYRSNVAVTAVRAP